MANIEEKFVGQADRLSGHPDSVRAPLGVNNTTMDMNMKIDAPLSSALDNNKSFMGRAVEHLNRETQRGEHAPMVGGHKVS